VNVNSGVFTGSSAPANIPSLDSLDMTTSTSFTPPANTASYTVVRTIASDSTDDVPANNALPNLNFSVTNYIYARDNNTVSGNTSNGVDGFEAGNLFDIWADQTLKAINVRLVGGGASGTTIGTEIYARLYSIDPNSGEFVFEEESAPLVVASNNLNTNLVMQLQTPVNMLANTTYLAVVGSYTGGLRIANAGTSEPQTSFFLEGNDISSAANLFYQTSTPYVRLNFDPSVGLEEETTEINGVSLYPNPSSSETNINFYLQTKSDVNILVTDLSGKAVSSLELTNVLTGSNSAKIDCSSLNSGVYYVTINTANSSITKKFVKK
jgi:hypothetical protein